MIYIFTGLPGAAKTLCAINRVLTDNQLKDRPVYYHGIDELKLPWFKVDPKEWESLPDGSVIVIDEAWKIFPLRPTGSYVPTFIQGLTEHRHRGFDFVLITQDATLIDAFVRKLCERHFHLKRPFGLDYAVVHEFHGVSDPNNGAAQKGALSTRFKHPKHLYGVYKSATIHAVKKRVPMKIFLFPVCFIALALIGNFIYKKMYADKVEVKAVAAKSQAPQSSAPGQSSASSEGLPRSLPEYLDEFTPRTPELPHSAPIYDSLVSAVKDFPRISACLKSKDKCWCYTQQGSRLDLRPDVCYAFVANGEFDPYKQAQSMAMINANGMATQAKSIVNPQAQ